MDPRIFRSSPGASLPNSLGMNAKGTQMAKRTMKPDQFGPRVRFNWGFHDAAHDARRGAPARTEGTHMFALPAHDQAYCEGYRAGYAAQTAGEDTSSSQPAWDVRARR